MQHSAIAHPILCEHFANTLQNFEEDKEKIKKKTSKKTVETRAPALIIFQNTYTVDEKKITNKTSKKTVETLR